MPFNSMQNNRRNPPKILLLGNTDGINHGTSKSYEAQHAATLREATQMLTTCKFDIVVSKVSLDSDEGLILPSLLLELKQKFMLECSPIIIWYDTEEHLSFRRHANLAERAGLTIFLYPLSSSNLDINITSALAETEPHNEASMFYAKHIPKASHLAQALTSGADFKIVIQPQFDLKTGDIVSAEALARWNHNSKIIIPPSLFVPLAQESGLEQLLFYTVISKVVDLLLILQSLEIAVPIAVNASADILCTKGIGQWLGQKCHELALPCSLLSIELTEEIPVRDWLALHLELEYLSRQGFSIAMDDFGRGFASIDLLTQMPFTTLKIDRHFTHGLFNDPVCQAAVSSAVLIGHAIGLKIIAEGIEYSSQVEALLAQGCNIGQGIALSAPLEVEDFIRILTKRKISQTRMALT